MLAALAGMAAGKGDYLSGVCFARDRGGLGWCSNGTCVMSVTCRTAEFG